MRGLLVAVAVLSLAACKTGGDLGGLTGGLAPNDDVLIQTKVAFSPDQAKYVLKHGTAKVTGMVNLIGVDGVHRPPDTGYVELWPSTPYTDDRIRRRFGDRKISRTHARITNKDSRFTKYTRRAQLEPGGRYTFENLAPGAYYLVASAAITNSIQAKNNGVAWERIFLSDGQALHRDITGL